jgi:hypothetical protein
MRIYFFFSVSLLLLTACNTGEGLGGSSSIEGYVYQVEHSDDNFTFHTDTFAAAKKDVYLIFGSTMDEYFGDDVETDAQGRYRFDYLRRGSYTVFAYSEFDDVRREAVSRSVEVAGGLNRADTLWIHTGKAYGTSMVRGSVYALFYDGTRKVDEGWAIDHDVYINRWGEEMFFDRIRVGDQGVFVFQKIVPGRYVVWVASEDPETRKLSPIRQEVVVVEAGQVYDLAEGFTVIARA